MKYIAALILTIFLTQTANAAKFEVLDEWECFEFTCAILKDPDGTYLLALFDKDGLYKLYIKGKVVWTRVTA